MYVREEDVFTTIYQQLKEYVREHSISDSQYKQRMKEFTTQINDLAQRKEEAWMKAAEHFEQFVENRISREEFRTVQDAANDAKEVLTKILGQKANYEKQYRAFRKILFASSKEIPLSEIMGCIDKIVVDSGRQIVVKWCADLQRLSRNMPLFNQRLQWCFIV